MGGKQWLGIFAMLGLFYALAVWVTWPLFPQFSRALPSGNSTVATVPEFNAWTIWWNANQLRHSFTYYWHAPIFAPEGWTFTYSEPQPATLWVAPLVWIVSIPMAYNTYLFTSLILNGFASYYFLRQCRCLPIPSLAGSIAALLHPLALEKLEAIQLVPLWGIVLCLVGCLRMFRAPGLWNALLLGCGFTVTALGCLHHALFLAVLLPPCLLSLWMAKQVRWQSHAWIWWGLAVAVPVLLVGPMISTMLEVHQEKGFHRSLTTVSALSGNLSNWLPLNTFGFLRSESSFHLNPGWLRLLLALGSCFLVIRHRPSFWLLSSLTLVSFTLSFGANLNIGGWSFWSWLCEWFSPLASVRSPYRFAYFTQLGILFLATLTADRIWRRFVKMGRQHGQSTWQKKLLATMTLCVLAFEVFLPRTYLCHPPLVAHSPDWVVFVRSFASPSDHILCLPTAENEAESSYEVATTWMLYGTQHSRRLLNGYSGFIPAHWRELRAKLQKPNWDPEVFRILREYRTKFIVLRRDQTPLQLNQYPAELELKFKEADTEVWELRTQAPTTETTLHDR